MFVYLYTPSRLFWRWHHISDLIYWHFLRLCHWKWSQFHNNLYLHCRTLIQVVLDKRKEKLIYRLISKVSLFALWRNIQNSLHLFQKLENSRNYSENNLFTVFFSLSIWAVYTDTAWLRKSLKKKTRSCIQHQTRFTIVPLSRYFIVHGIIHPFPWKLGSFSDYYQCKVK